MPLLERAVRATLAGEGVPRGEFSIAFLADPPIRELNRKWLGHDWAPDVLSFALHDPGEPPVADVYVGVEQADRQAREHGVSFEEELVRLCIHGTLHVLGYDHGAQEEEEGTAKSAMFRKQEALVREVMAGARVAGSASQSRRPEI
ncbi:MAG: rRNA maturation RNase YbeY [Gemmatimonadota bacterium]